MNTQAAPAQAGQWSLGGLERVDACPACGSTARSDAGMVCNDPGIFLKDDLWVMHECAGCRSLYLNPKPDAASLVLAYREYETHIETDPAETYQRTHAVVWALVNGYLNSRFGLMRSYANRWSSLIFNVAVPWRQKLDYYCRHLYPERFRKGKRLLDVGCGNGAFLVIASEMGWEVLGVDPDLVGVELCVRKGMPAIHGTLSDLLPQHASQFDAITMSHSIEHLDDMPSELRKVFQLLKPGGRLWLATPNPRSFGALWFGRAWRGLRPPYHLCIPSQQGLHDLLASSGFTDIRMVRRGVHARRAFRESARSVEKLPMTRPRMRVWLAPLIGAFSDLVATFFVGYAEETVLIASKPHS